jgi:hypothetical protein
MKTTKHERVAYWLKKDAGLTTAQLRELTGANANLIGKVRKELGISNAGMATFEEVDQAFKRFMKDRKHDNINLFNPSYSLRKDTEG